MSNCNFPICLSPTEESSDESKLQPKQKTQKIPPKNKVKAKRAILTPAEATIGDLESEDKENINPFSSVLDSEIRSVEQLVAVGDGVKQARDLNVNRPLSDLEISTCVKGGKIGRKRREHVEEIGNDDGKPDNEHRRDLEDTKSVKNGKIKKNKKENVKENETGDENNDKNRIVVENKVQKLAETGVDCEKQRKSRPIKKYGRKKGKGNVDNDDKKESDEDRDSSDSFKVKINRKDLLFMNDEPAKKNENGGKRGKEKGNCNKKVKEIDGKRKEEGKQVVEKCGTIEENRCEKENAGKEECRMEIKNDNSKIDDGKMQSKTDSIKRVEEELNERKNEKRDEIEDKKINDEENGLVENKQKRMERGRIGKSSSIVLNDSKNENGSKEDGENEINFMENADKGKKRREVEKGRNNVDKLLTSQNQFMDEEKIEEVRDGHVSNDRIVHDSQIKNKDKKQDRIEKDLREDRSKKTDLDSNSCQEKNRNTDESDDDLGNTEDDDQQTDMKKLNRKKTLSLSDWSSIIENNKLDGTDPSGKVEKNKKKLGNIVIENKGEHRYKNDCYKCEVVSRRIYEPYPKSQIDWLGNSPYVSYLDRERNNEADYSFNFEMAKKRSLENYLNKVKSKKMMSDEEAQDKTRTKLSENCRITNESDKILRLTSPVLSSSEQIEARRRKRKKVPFVKYTSGGPSSPIKADCATSRRYGLLDSSFCVRDRSGCSKMSYDDDVLQNKTTENQDEIFDPDVSLSTEIEIRNEKRKLDTQKIEKRNRKLRNFESNPSFLSELESSNEKILEKKDLEEREKEQTENKETNNDSSAQSLSSENFETPPKRPNFTPTLIEAKPVCKRLSKNKKLVIRKIYGCRILEKGDRYLRSEKNNGTTTSTQQHTSGDSPMKMDLEQAANSAVEEPAPTLTVMTSKPPPAIKIKTEPDMAATAAATAATSAAANSRAAGGSSSSSSSSSCSNGSSVIGSEEISASMASASDVTPTNPWSSTKCIFCGQVLSANDDPKLLECLHAACMHCVTSRLKENPILEADGIATESIVVCPRCLVNCRESMIIDNYFLSESLTSNSTGGDGADGTESGENKMADLKCGSCPEMAAATSWCVDCAEFICDGCVQAHQRLKITKEHTIKPKEEAEPENNSVQQGVLPKSQLCSVHSQERLTLFCEACDRLTCRDCQLTSHRDHKYKFINEIAAETRTLISSLLSEVTYKRVLLKSAMKVIDDRQRLIMEKRKELVNDITQMVVKLTNTINTRGKQLVVRLNDVCDAKQVTLNEKKQALDQLSNLTDDCIEFVNNALDQGSDMALLASKTNLTSHLQRIKSRRADIPNPEIPVRISLALDKVPELIKVASSIGSIIVDGRTYPPPSGSSSNSGGTPSAGGGGGTGAGPSSLATPPATVVPPINIKTEAGQHKSHHPPAYDAVVAHQAPPPPPPPLQQAPPHGAGQGNSAMMNQNQQAQQLMSRHYTSPPQQQMSNAAAAAAYQNRTSPLQSMAQMPGQIVRSLQQQIVRNHHNQGAVSMTRVGGGPHQQQVTSSTHPGAGGVGGGAAGADGSLRSMLSLHYHQQQQQQQHMHQQQQQQLQQQQQAHHQQFMANHAMRTTSPQNQQIYVHRLGGPGGPPNVIVTASSTQPGYLPPPQGHPPHMVSAQGQHAARYPSPYQQAQVGQQQQQQHNRPPPGSYSSAARQLVQRVQSPHSSNQLQQQQQQSHRGSPAAAAGGSSGMLSWHIPQQQQQQQQHSSSSQLSQQAAAKQAAPPPLIQLPLAADDTSFKITLKQQINSQTTPSSGTKTPLSSSSTSSSLSSSPAAAALSAAQSQPTCVTSSVPKTPSPRLSSTKASDDAEKCLDKFCQDSVNDLMMTIAKLDSHGTKVIPEGGGGGGAETNGPLVDSSTDSSAVTARPASSTGHRDNTQGNARQSQSQRESQKDDPNEDWCAVCLDGGEPVLCCDYCPKVFHIKCHIPRIPDFPDESDPWQCLLCTDMVPVSNKVAAIGVKRKASTALTSEEQKLVERILLELYCQYDPSLHFREIVSPENTSYYEVIKKPMSLEKVRQKLDPADTTVEKYTSVEDVISDIRLIFKNAYIYNSINSQVYTDAKTLEELLDQMLEKWIPTLATELMEAEEETASAIAANNEQEQEEEEEGDGEEGGEEEAEEDEEEEVEENEDNLQPPAAKRKRRSISD